MINLFTEFAENNRFDLSSLEVLAYGGSPMAPDLVRRTRRLLPNIKLVQVYGLSETGFLTGLQDHDHTEDHSSLAGGLAPGIEIQVPMKRAARSRTPASVANWSRADRT